MDEKKYETGKVEISSAEYRDLIKEAIEARCDASQARSDKWRLEDEKRKISQELELANKKIAELESVVSNLQAGLVYAPTYAPNTVPNKPWWSEVTCSSNAKEEK